MHKISNWEVGMRVTSSKLSRILYECYLADQETTEHESLLLKHLTINNCKFLCLWWWSCSILQYNIGVSQRCSCEPVVRIQRLFFGLQNLGLIHFGFTQMPRDKHLTSISSVKRYLRWIWSIFTCCVLQLRKRNNMKPRYEMRAWHHLSIYIQIIHDTNVGQNQQTIVKSHLNQTVISNSSIL